MSTHDPHGGNGRRADDDAPTSSPPSSRIPASNRFGQGARQTSPPSSRRTVPPPASSPPTSTPTSTLSSMQKAIIALDKVKERLDAVERQKTEPVAIIGMACRFPGGGVTPEAFFQRLLEGGDAVTEVPRDRWQADPSDEGDADPSVRATRWGAFLREPVDEFDARFFGVSPREAAHLDPQQRLLLELSWEALERAGQDQVKLVGSSTGVFVGTSTSDYLELCKAAGAAGVDVYTATGNGPAFASGRLSYALGLQGPSVAVDTACSSSLVAVHLACQSLRSGDASMAIAAGVNLMLSPNMTRLVGTTKALAPDGRCRTFDAAASGFVRGEGAGVVVLKLLSDAQRDGDPIVALVRGSAVNQDGRSTGLTTPNVLSQEAMLLRALTTARASADDIGYVEAHGTGTSLGDPIEVEALRAVFGKQPRPDRSRCVLGAVKTNIGHLEAAAGIAGLIKAAMALRMEVIPRNLHFRSLNPRISIEGTPFRIPTENLPWRRSGKPRLAGVSSFGLSGTNAHVVLEEGPGDRLDDVPAPEASSYLVPISARSPGALRALARSYSEAISAERDARLHEIAYTASVRRTHHDHRLAVVGRTHEEIAAALAAFADDGASSAPRTAGERRPKVVFVFPGQGSQWLGMARQLLREEQAFREAIHACEEPIKRLGGFSVIEQIHADEGSSRLGEISVVQPVLFAIEVALANLWRFWGVEPDAVVGHSMGEVAAARVAGVLSLEDAAKVICRRSRLLRRVSGQGAMALVELSREVATQALDGYEDRLGVAVSNGPRSTVISGDPEALDEVLASLEKAGVFCRRVKVDVASHSPQMDPLREEFLAALRNVQPRSARLTMRSTVTGQAVIGPELDASYWARNLRDPVLFSTVVQKLVDDGYTHFVEMSPHPILLQSVEENLRERNKQGVALGSMRRETDERRTMLNALGELYARGYPVAWKQLYPQGGRCVPLPTYAWQRERHWIEGAPRASAVRVEPGRAAPDTAAREAELERRTDPPPHASIEALRSAPPELREEMVERLVREKIARILHVDPGHLARGEQLHAYGFDSLMGLELRNRLQEALGIELSVADIVAHPRIDVLSRLLSKRLAAPLETSGLDAEEEPANGARRTLPGSWVVIPRPSPAAEVRLFCFPYSGGSASAFGAWPGHFPPGIEVCAIQPPGRHERMREPSLRSVEEMVAALVPALLPYLDRPFAAFGHSLGAIVMFEALRVLAARHDLLPIRAFVSGAASPRRFRVPNPGTRSPEELADIVRSTGLGRLGVLEDEDAARALLPALASDLEAAACYTYAASGLLDAPITAFAGQEDAFAPPGLIEEWREHTSSSFSKVVLPGEHYFIVSEREALLARIREELLPRLGSIAG